MKALLNCIVRLCSTNSQIPHRTVGIGLFAEASPDKATFAGWIHERALHFFELAQRTAPTVIVIVLNIFR